MDNQYNTPTPIPPMRPTPSAHREVRMILPALLVVLLLGAGYFAWKKYSPVPVAQTPVPNEATTTAPASDVQVVKTDLTSGACKLPEGFPSNVPVDVAGIVESYKAYYKDHNVTQYTIAYNSIRSKDTLWDEYSKALPTAGFTLDPRNLDKAKGTMVVYQTGLSLTLVITSKGTGAYVQLTLIDSRTTK